MDNKNESIDDLKKRINDMSFQLSLKQENIEYLKSDRDNFKKNREENTDSEERFKEMIDKEYDEIKIFGITFEPSRILEKLDPIAFSVYLGDFEADDSDSDSDLDEIPEYVELCDEIKYQEEKIVEMETYISELKDELLSKQKGNEV